MIKGRTPNIRTEQLRTFTNKLVASSKNKFGNRSISKEKFNKLLERAPVQFGRQLRSQKMVSTYQTRKFLGDFLKHIQEHPDYKVSTFARKALNVKLHQGDNLIHNFDPEHVGEKGLAYVANAQEKEDAAKNTGPDEKELKRLERRKQANILIGRSQRLRAEDGGQKSSGFVQPSLKITDTSGRTADAGSAAVKRGAEVKTSVAGETQTAGQKTAATPIPGQLKGASSAPSRSTVQLTSLGGLDRLTHTPGRAAPTIGAPDTLGSASARRAAETPPPAPGGLTDKYASEAEDDTPPAATPTEVTDIRPAKSADDSDDEDINRNLPLAA